MLFRGFWVTPCRRQEELDVETGEASGTLPALNLWDCQRFFFLKGGAALD